MSEQLSEQIKSLLLQMIAPLVRALALFLSQVAESARQAVAIRMVGAVASEALSIRFGA